MKQNEALEEITNSLSAEIKQGVLVGTIKKRLINNGASVELAEKVARISQLKSI